MNLGFWKQVSSAVAGLSPDVVIQESEAPFTIALVGSQAEVSAMEDWLVPPSLNPAQQAQARRQIYSLPTPLGDSERAWLPNASLRLVGPSTINTQSSEVTSRDSLIFNRA